MQIGTFAVLLFVTATEMAAGPQGGRRAPVTARVTGTYTNMHFSREGGDILGVELKIVVGRNGGYQAALQFAEGTPGDLVVVPITISNRTIRFQIPEPYAGDFEGTMTDGAIRGRFRYASGGIENALLRKGRSYWE